MSRIRQYQSSQGLQSGDELTLDALYPHLPSRPGRLIPLIVLSLGTLVTGDWLANSWLQPTVVGLLWGTLFLLGCGAGSGLVARSTESFGCGVIAYFCWQAAGKLCDIPVAENLLISAILAGTGWISGRVVSLQRRPLVQSSIDLLAPATGHSLRARQWSLADLLSLTTFVGCLAWGIPRLTAGAELMTEVWLTLIAALLGSLLATAWVWIDQWTLRRLAILGALLMCLLATVALGPAGDELRLSLFAAFPAQAATGQAIFSLLYLSQVLTGPAAVVSAQALSVMSTQAWWRWLARSNRSNLCTSEPASGVKLCLTSLD